MRFQGVAPLTLGLKRGAEGLAYLVRRLRRRHRATTDRGAQVDGVMRVPTRFVLKYTLRVAPRELGGVDLDLAVEDDVLPLDRADVPQQVGVEREVRRGGQP